MKDQGADKRSITQVYYFWKPGAFGCAKRHGAVPCFYDRILTFSLIFEGKKPKSDPGNAGGQRFGGQDDRVERLTARGPIALEGMLQFQF